MRKYLWCLFSVLGLAAFSAAPAQTPGNSEKNRLEEGFRNVPDYALPKVYWWWLNGNVSKARLKDELVEMKKAGITGVDIFDIGLKYDRNPGNMIPGGPPFMGKESLEALQYAIGEAGKLNMEVNLSLSSSWNAGGSWTQPEHAAKTVYHSKVKVKGGAGRQYISLPFPLIERDKKGNPRLLVYDATGKPAYYREITVLAIPAGQQIQDTSAIINVSAFFDEEKETLHWTVPAGEWEIHRYVCANSGERLSSPSEHSNGYIIDHFDSAATRSHVMFFVNKLQPLLGDFRKTALKAFYLASYEVADFTWTPSLPKEFRKLNGYDIYKFIPVLFNRNLFPTDLSEGFLFDFRKTLSELMINNHYKKAKEICHEYGLKLVSESGGPGGWHNIPVEVLKALGSLDIPRGEFWYKNVVYDKGDSIDVKWLVKEIAAAAHIYKRGLVEQEAFTSRQDWQEGPADLKVIADQAFGEGMNRLVIHGFSHNPSADQLPGPAFYAGTHYNDRNTWWPKIRPFNDYLGRISYILQKSDFVADVLYYYGDDVPNLVPPKNTRFTAGPGFEYEVINSEILLNELRVENRMLVLPGVGRYHLLCIKDNSTLTVASLSKLRELAAAGAIIIGNPPKKVAGLSSTEKGTSALIGQLWATYQGGSSSLAAATTGKIYSGLSPIEVLRSRNILPDFTYEDQPAHGIGKIDYTHYSTGELDFYLLRNATDQWISRECYFRQEGKIPEIWDPVTGKVIPLNVYKKQGKQTEALITLAPFETYFVVFRKGSSIPKYAQITGAEGNLPLVRYTPSGVHILGKGKFALHQGDRQTSIEAQQEVIPLKGAWQVSFPRGYDAPDSIKLERLISWTETREEGVRYFSGTATYRQSFEFKRRVGRNEKIYLDLGDVSEVAEVWLNERPLGITWCRPFSYDVTNIIKSGKNTIRIEVANTWSNRLIGDAITGKKFTHTNVLSGNRNPPDRDMTLGNNHTAPWKEIPLRKSGLMGEVTINILKSY